MEGIVRSEESREIIMEHVRGKGPMAMEDYRGDTGMGVPDEIVAIKSLLEKN